MIQPAGVHHAAQASWTHCLRETIGSHLRGVDPVKLRSAILRDLVRNERVAGFLLLQSPNLWAISSKVNRQPLVAGGVKPSLIDIIGQRTAVREEVHRNLVHRFDLPSLVVAVVVAEQTMKDHT